MFNGVFYGLRVVVDIVFNMIQLLVIGSMIISWVNADPSNPIVQMIRQFTEPLYRPIRRLTGKFSGPIDFAPFIVVLIVIFLQKTIGYYLGVLTRDSL